MHLPHHGQLGKMNQLTWKRPTSVRAPNEPALRNEGREDEPPRRLMKTMVRAPNEPTMQEEGRENEPAMKSQEKANVGTQDGKINGGLKENPNQGF